MANRPYTCLFMSLLWLMVFPAFLSAEFYKYVDENGKSFYVDDISKVPAQYQNQLKKYEEKADVLSAKEKRAIEQQKEKEQQQRQWRRQQALIRERKRLAMQRQNSVPSKPLADYSASSNYTKVVISNGQVLVPVKFSYKGTRSTATLLLDTGANKTLIHKDVGDQLGLDGGKKVGIQVVGGAVIPGRHILVDTMEVGPHKQKGIRVIMIDEPGRGMHQGLLGMDFLMGKKFHVDYDRQRLVWSR